MTKQHELFFFFRSGKKGEFHVAQKAFGKNVRGLMREGQRPVRVVVVLYSDDYDTQYLHSVLMSLENPSDPDAFTVTRSL